VGPCDRVRVKALTVVARLNNRRINMVTAFTIFLLPLFIVGMAMVFLVAMVGALAEDFWHQAIKGRRYNPYTKEYEEVE
jgi:hypothetical protein